MASLERALSALCPLLVLAALNACGSPPPPVEAPPAPVEGPRVLFSYPTIDGGTLSTETLAGRNSVLAFVTTYDPASQAQARFLTGVVRRHVPRINAGIIVLEPEEHRPLIEAFGHALGLPYPVALGDKATIAGEGPFQGLHHVPSIVILDRDGREVWRHLGIVKGDDIDLVLRALEQGKALPQPAGGPAAPGR
jgi:hypothetical protein